VDFAKRSLGGWAGAVGRSRVPFLPGNAEGILAHTPFSTENGRALLIAVKTRATSVGGVDVEIGVAEGRGSTGCRHWVGAEKGSCVAAVDLAAPHVDCARSAGIGE